MAASNTPKKSTTKRGTSAKKKSSARTQSKKNTAGKQSISSGFQTEIILLVLMAAAIILMVSCVGLGGNVGGSISKVLMGVMGLMAYIFPVVLFIMAAFLISNKGNVLAYKKTAAAAVLFLICCGLAQLLQKAIQRVQLLQNITGSVLSIVLVAEPLEAQSVFLQSPHLEPSVLM